ncbi:protein adenylyltransferase SelO [Rhodoferax sp.]|uniref:protein adenylyltransferase SelO n=1 Tax=Rhodoferax sp. TaxID=50421 RepID=UPI002612FBA3|nr:YdiU family protein [Rhodoferax sp.]MDD2808460.1 YdiU family protein [Rhodoferax sp.]
MQCVQTGLSWNNRFQQLGTDFYTPLAPEPISQPYWVASSLPVAELLGLNPALLHSHELLQGLAGNWPISGTQPLASVYSGHQFGNWAGQLGDGRAILLGEVNGLELQLKGSGLTPYSRMGDGRAVLRSSIREFLCSEAMHGLGIPTTRALCVVGSDDEVWRETLETTAVVTRVAPSFIRFGHFEHFSARRQHDQLKTLADYCLERYAPECLATTADAPNVYVNLLHWASQRTALTLAHWQAVGFCHGVMNTDNMSLLGLTMDYGPFQFLDGYDPDHICNHTDRSGRYAFQAQPSVAHWNLYALAQALMPLMKDQTLAVAALNQFEPSFKSHWHRLMCAKLGLAPAWAATGAEVAEVAEVLPGTPDPAQAALISELLSLLGATRVDYTLFWRRLSVALATQHFEPVRDMFLDRPGFDRWLLHYSELSTHTNKALQADLMLKTNPKYVLRNYMAEEAIRAAKLKDFSVLAHLLQVLQHPFDEHPSAETWAGFPPDWAANIAISCSS